MKLREDDSEDTKYDAFGAKTLGDDNVSISGAPIL